MFDKVFPSDSRVAGTRGWRVVIHERDTAPGFDESFDILPGTSMSMALTTTQISRLPYPHGNCARRTILQDTKFVETKSACMTACLRNAIENHCGCVSAKLALDHTRLFGKYCLFYNESDQFQIFRNYNWELGIRRQEIEDHKKGLHSVCEENCHWRCDETLYEVQTSLATFPTKEAMAWFFTNYLYNNPNKNESLAWSHFIRDVKDPNMSAEEYKYKPSTKSQPSVIPITVSEVIKSSFARVNIYFKTMTIQKKIQNQSYTLGQLWADIGGTLGLWVGLSVFAVVDFATKLKSFFSSSAHVADDSTVVEVRSITIT